MNGRPKLNAKMKTQNTGTDNGWSPAQVREWLAYAPAEPGPIAPRLRGFTINSHFYCSRCCGRVAARGLLLPRLAIALWREDYSQPVTCAACGTNP